MFVLQFVNEGLGNSSYLIGSQEAGVGAVIDPQRDVDVYLEAAQDAGLRIAYALETHLPADFVSGSRELAAKTGATIGASAAGNLQFEHLPLKEGDKIELGEITLEVMETPGHSPEHVSYLVREPGNDKPTALFSGGALIVGGAARTDLLGHEHTHALTEQLYDTMHKKLKSLPDEVEVYPAHGAGSFCIASHEEERTTTIGQERQRNPLLQASSREEFVRLALEGLPSYPAYFERLRYVNQKGPPVLGGLPQLQPLPPPEVERRLKTAAVIDVRSFIDFAAGHIPGAYGIPLRESFSTWLGWVVPQDRPLMVVSDGPENLEDMVRQSIRIGYDKLDGYLEGGMAAWKAAGYSVEKSGLKKASEVHRQLQKGEKLVVLDVRQDAEWAEGRIPGATHIELGQLEKGAGELPRDVPIVVHCSHGLRSNTGVSLLLRKGFKQVANMARGMTAWERARLPIDRTGKL